MCKYCLYHIDALNLSHVQFLPRVVYRPFSQREALYKMAAGLSSEWLS